MTARIDAPALAAWTLGFAVVTYLAFSNGGYDTIVRSQVGIAIWWIVLLGALAGVLPARIGRAGWIAVGLLATFAVWTGFAATWSESAERSMIELGRVAMYLGVLVLAIALQGRTAARHTVSGLACAIAVVALLAVLSRLHPQWFPTNDHLEFLGAAAARRLSYPLNYWNALAALVALGVPLLLGLAVSARTLVGRGLAAAALPVSALCIYLTISRGGALALIVGIVVFLLFASRRVAAVGTLLVAGVGSAILVSAAAGRDALQDGVPTAAAIHEGNELIWLLVIVCAGVALLQVAMSVAEARLTRPAMLSPGRRATAVGAVAIALCACGLAVALGVPGWADEQWQGFTAPSGQNTPASQDDVFSRLHGVDGNNRYQIWDAAREAQSSAPVRGIGPGTFEFWWARNGTARGFIRDAHSLYFETLAETGIVGLALLLALFAVVLAAAAARALRGPPRLRTWIAAAVGAVAAFMTSAALEWVWEIAAVACAAMMLAAVVLCGRADRSAARADEERPRVTTRSPRAALAVMALAALTAIAIPLAAGAATRDSREAAADGRLQAAYQETQTAQRLQPYASTPLLQRALVLEEEGNLTSAATAARRAVDNEPTNWRTWFVMARINARRGEILMAVMQFRKATRLNPRSGFLAAG